MIRTTDARANRRPMAGWGQWLALLTILSGGIVRGASDEELRRRASWSPPSVVQTRTQLLDWLESQEIQPELRAQLAERWEQAEGLRPDQVLEQLVTSLGEIDPRIREVHAFCQRSRPAYELQPVTIVTDADLPDWIRANLRLYYGIWLARQQLFDEAAEQLAGVSVEQVVDPAALLFYQSVAAHRRLEKERCLTTLVKLLENEEQLPQRYAVVARLMQSDLEPLRPDSLDEISRLMDNIHVRLGHGRAGKRVRQEEDDVVSKLDKLIEQLEQQAQAAAAAAGAAGGNNAPSAPMEDSMPGGGSGPGNVDPKSLGTDTDWGNLPPKEREEALQQLSKDLPSHYREVIEEYFRKLAREGERR
jgi:hypothetical protein